MPSLVFRDAEVARDNICIEDQKKIRDLYKEWAEEVGEKAKYYENKTTASSYWQQQQMLELQRQMKSQSAEIHKQIESGAKQSMYTVADSVVGCNAKFLEELGFLSKDGSLDIAMTSIPPNVVNNIVTGQIYESGWSLSKAIWGDNEKTLADIYEIVAKGRAMNMSAYDVSKMLERYVSPAKAKMWNLKMADGVRIYKRSVDYNAQRLVRTLNQHAYQQSIIQVAKDNPFIGDIIWHANGSRACPLCIERDGQRYKPEDVPMDHPNGMCVMEPVTDMDKTIDQLADWVNSPDGTYPEIDEFAKQFGYIPSSDNTVQEKASEVFEKMSQQQYLEWQAQHSTREQLDKQIEDEFDIKLHNGQLSYDDDRFIESGPYKGMWLQDVVDKNTDLISTAERSYGCGYVQNADGSKAINAYWRTGQVGRMYRKSEILETSNALDQLIQSTQINQSVSVDRWAGAKSLERMGINVTGTEERIGHAFVTNMDPHDIVEQINGKLTGAIIEDKTYMSASMQSELNVFRGSDVCYVIQVPSGTNAYITDNTKESEVIFARGTKQEILGAKVAQAEAYDYEGKPTSRQIVEITVRIVSE